ncbi:YcaO-like family protein [Deinococcus cellulosilyticus]|uniref:YcaO domain-containing protein n=1 Tax=Deinococcus cellulosilyticus (strain DSM 18568 / NBRC 106333 / KACC 11606 / 5516J-15) TaxID=1223518 RepID=A0A511N364_DEIC1|nr:YcaO-like family protein [Deinococcus cellulosilyticus]GEM46898.1 hypothetical protein DC3_25330 [Deinococcus cellulosilyticus NBRC 106333 = KACC 11606]
MILTQRAPRVISGGGYALLAPEGQDVKDGLQHLLENSGHPVHLYPHDLQTCPLQDHLIETAGLHLQDHNITDALLIHLQTGQMERIPLAKTTMPCDLKLDLQKSVARSGLPDLRWDRLISPLGPLLGVNAEKELSIATAQLASKAAGQRVYGVGRADRIQASRTIAALEALERLGGLFPDPSRQRMHASMGDLPGQVLDPRSLHLYFPLQHQQRDFPCKPFEEDQPRTWVCGLNLKTLQPVWIEESLVYYGPMPDPLVLNTSSGCALGQSLEEATLHAFLELAERDAAMRWWQGTHKAPLWPTPFEDDVLEVLGNLFDLEYQVQAHDLTTDLGLPVCLLVATQKEWDGLHPATLCATAAHLDPRMALLKAVQEIRGMAQKLTPQQLEKAALLQQHPEQVLTLEDHLLAYALPAARDAIASKLSGELGLQRDAWVVPDLQALLQHTLDHCELHVVQQDHPVLREQGLFCVRVISPQLLPITYGHPYQRVPASQAPTADPHPFT